ncbi:MAG: hypothetical protein KME18_02775 [Phormidium tanganyikae FI6-MK23]|jgi:hypothetical protein|nr:hypothetical protein [Phormidium tanganyikae FI6-MK23]
MSNYTTQAVQAFLAVLLGGAIGLTLLATFAPVETGSLADTVKTRIQELQR